MNGTGSDTDTASQRVLSVPHGRRLFASLAEQPRSRRVTDVVTLIAAIVAVVGLSLVAVPTSGAERWLADRLAATPNLEVARHLAVGSLAAWALLLLTASVTRRRIRLARDLVLASMCAAVLAAGASILAHGTWVGGAFGSGAENSTWAPTLALAAPAAAVFAASPQLSHPARQFGGWLVLLVMIPLAADTRFPSSVLAGWLVAVVSAAIVHIVFGSSRGRPSLADVQVALDRLGVAAHPVGAADRQAAGVFLVNAADRDGNPLLVKIYGRDAKDARLVAGLWRRVWYRDPGTPARFGRQEQVEHEAFLTLLVERAGVPTQQVIAAGSTPQHDALLVLRPQGTALCDQPEAWTDEVAAGVWSMLDRLHRSGVAHGQLDDAHLVRHGAVVGIDDLRGGSSIPTPDDLHRDQAQALVATALALGPERALVEAFGALGAERLAAVLSFVQAPALTTRQQAEIKAKNFDLDALRAAAAELSGVEVPALQQLRRVTWRSALQIALMVFAVSILANQLAGLDLAALGVQLRDATWWLVLTGAVVAQTPRIAQAVSTLGASPRPIPLKPVYFLQLAVAYIGLVVPSSAARIAINVRFFQRQGLETGSALAVGAIDGFAGFIVEMVVLSGLLLLTPHSIHLDLNAPSSSGWQTLLWILAGIAVVLGVAAILNAQRRHQAIEWLKGLVTDGYSAVRGLRSLRRLTLLFGGNLASDLLFAASLGTFAWALGTRVPFGDLVVFIISVSLLAGLLPIPGGVGVVEGGLTLGLVSAGMPEEAAFAAVILYRMATFYVPPVWGFFALRWLERNDQL